MTKGEKSTDRLKKETLKKIKKKKISKQDEYKETINELNDKYMRLLAEFENYKKRAAQERINFTQIANKDLMLSFLPVIDDFDRATKSIKKAKDINTIKEGMNLIYKKLKESLEKKGLKEMKTIGKEFNSDYHEAISKIPSKKLKNKVVDEIEKGYFLNDTIIRYAKVIVGE